MQNSILDPQYVDVLASDVCALELEVSLAKAAMAESIRAHEVSEVLKQGVCRYTDYLGKRDAQAARVREIAQRYGTFCKESGSLVLVGARHVLNVKDNQVTVIVCVEADKD